LNDVQRKIYFGQLWPAACQAKGWRVKDDVRRQHTTAECMRMVKAPITDSTTALGPDQVTALFCYLDHLVHPGDLIRAAKWVDCQTDYRAYNRARQADWHQRKAYGRGGRKLTQNRFGGAATAEGEPFEKFDPAAIRKRHLTMASRHRRKQAAGEHRNVAAQAVPHAFVATVGGKVVLGPVLVDETVPF